MRLRLLNDRVQELTRQLEEALARNEADREEVREGLNELKLHPSGHRNIWASPHGALAMIQPKPSLNRIRPPNT